MPSASSLCRDPVDRSLPHTRKTNTELAERLRRPDARDLIPHRRILHIQHLRLEAAHRRGQLDDAQQLSAKRRADDDTVFAALFTRPPRWCRMWKMLRKYVMNRNASESVFHQLGDHMCAT